MDLKTNNTYKTVYIISHKNVNANLGVEYLKRHGERKLERLYRLIWAYMGLP